MNPYVVLGVPPTATLEEIRSAWRRRAFALHPDRGGTSEAFAEASRAWAIVSDPESRAALDASLSAPAPAPAPAAPAPAPPSRRAPSRPPRPRPGRSPSRASRVAGDAERAAWDANRSAWDAAYPMPTGPWASWPGADLWSETEPWSRPASPRGEADAPVAAWESELGTDPSGRDLLTRMIERSATREAERDVLREAGRGRGVLGATLDARALARGIRVVETWVAAARRFFR